MSENTATVCERIRCDLFALKDEKYADFVSTLIPAVERKSIIGVRTPALRKYARSLSREETDAFLSALPHVYYEENNLHAYLLSDMRDAERTLSMVEVFLPYVDNWATCDVMRPKIFKKHTDMIYERIPVWLSSGRTYTVRYAVGMLHYYFLGDAFSASHLALTASVCSEEYYVNMMLAWYFAEALVRQREATLPYFFERIIPEPVFSMACRKAQESYRVSSQDKAALRRLRK